MIRTTSTITTPKVEAERALLSGKAPVVAPAPKVDRVEHTPPVGVRWHEYADIFPWIEGDAYRALVEDIRKNGVLEPIVFLDGAILDGRNRYMAAREIGIEYPRVEYEGDDPLGYVISKNARRRDLTASQRAAIALTIEKELAKVAKERSLANLTTTPKAEVAILPPRQEPQSSAVSEVPAGDAGAPPTKAKSRDLAAASVGASPRYVQDAKAIEKASPELLQKVKSGETTIASAMREIAPKKPNHAVPANDDPTGRQVEALRKLWAITGPEARKAFLAEVSNSSVPTSSPETTDTPEAGAYASGNNSVVGAA